ncbi:sensor histidine kinase [Ectothiorhodospiraceae bacterium WFHF3C12]|nr:sensor histidine kinase [Ectothiorhodospiraceae bacterium WFHF3C12]
MVSWRKSLAGKFFAFSLLAALVPLLIVSALYDRYSVNLIDSLTGERMERRLAAVSGRLRAFMDARWYALENLAGYPAVHTLLRADAELNLEQGLKAVVEFEADQPDLYGVLLFDRWGQLVRAIPGRAASGPPYWGEGTFSLEGLNRIDTPEGRIFGPVAPRTGHPGFFLMARDLPGRTPGDERLGTIALHVRLSSVTELLGNEDETGLFYPVLMADDGRAFSNVGLPTQPDGRVIKGASLIPGWRPALVVEGEELVMPLQRVRYAMVVAVAGIVLLLPLVYFVFLRRTRGRIGQLVDGAEEVASGNLSWRIRPVGRDEVAILARAFNGMAERLQRVVRSTVEMEKMALLGQFAAGIAHEIRNPLATVKTSVQGLAVGEADTERRQILNVLGDEIDRLDETLEEVLNFARPHEPQFETVSVRDLFRRLLGMVDKQARDAGVSTVAAGLRDAHVQADPFHLQQIMMNLVLNAMQAMPEGGQLTLRAAAAGDNIEIEVRDTGVGIPADALGRITDPFYTTRADGTGLGLAITRQLVELNRGELSFASAPGQGTTVTITLPRAGGAEGAGQGRGH